MGSPATSPLAPDGYQWEGIWVQILSWQTDCIIVHIGGLAPVIQVCGSLLLSQVAKTGPLRAGATESILLGKTLTGGTLLSAV